MGDFVIDIASNVLRLELMQLQWDVDNKLNDLEGRKKINTSQNVMISCMVRKLIEEAIKKYPERRFLDATGKRK